MLDDNVLFGVGANKKIHCDVFVLILQSRSATIEMPLIHEIYYCRNRISSEKVDIIFHLSL
jgi:hypothetical protein